MFLFILCQIINHAKILILSITTQNPHYRTIMIEIIMFILYRFKIISLAIEVTREY